MRVMADRDRAAGTGIGTRPASRKRAAGLQGQRQSCRDRNDV